MIYGEVSLSRKYPELTQFIQSGVFSQILPVQFIENTKIYSCFFQGTRIEDDEVIRLCVENTGYALTKVYVSGEIYRNLRNYGVPFKPNIN